MSALNNIDTANAGGFELAVRHDGSIQYTLPTHMSEPCRLREDQGIGSANASMGWNGHGMNETYAAIASALFDENTHQQAEVAGLIKRLESSVGAFEETGYGCRTRSPPWSRRAWKARPNKLSHRSRRISRTLRRTWSAQPTFFHRPRVGGNGPDHQRILTGKSGWAFMSERCKVCSSGESLRLVFDR